MTTPSDRIAAVSPQTPRRETPSAACLPPATVCPPLSVPRMVFTRHDAAGLRGPSASRPRHSHRRELRPTPRRQQQAQAARRGGHCSGDGDKTCRADRRRSGERKGGQRESRTLPGKRRPADVAQSERRRSSGARSSRHKRVVSVVDDGTLVSVSDLIHVVRTLLRRDALKLFALAAMASTAVSAIGTPLSMALIPCKDTRHE